MKFKQHSGSEWNRDRNKGEIIFLALGLLHKWSSPIPGRKPYCNLYPGGESRKSAQTL